METLGEAAARLLTYMRRRRPFPRLIAANDAGSGARGGNALTLPVIAAHAESSNAKGCEDSIGKAPRGLAAGGQPPTRNRLLHAGRGAELEPGLPADDFEADWEW